MDYNLIEQEMEQEMKQYSLLHRLERETNYQNNISNDTNSQELAKYIHENYYKMDEVELKVIALKCMDLNEFKRIILSYELKNYKPEQKIKTMSLDKFKTHVLKLLNRYQCKAGGFLIEDNEWSVHDNTSVKYEVEKNELLFENTISVVDEDDNEADCFLEYLVKRLNLIADNIDVILRQKQNEHSKVISLLLWAIDKNIEFTACAIGL